MAKKNQKPKSKKVTRIAHSLRLTDKKYAQLNEMAMRLGNLRSQVWQDFGSINAIGIDFLKLRNQWVSEKRDLGVPANMWKETLDDTLSNIAAYLAAAKEKVERSIYRSFPGKDNKELRDKLKKLLKGNDWVFDKWLCTKVRKYWVRGHNHTYNQINVRSDDFSLVKTKSEVTTCLKFSSLTKGKRIAIPLTGNPKIPQCNLRIILHGNNTISVHYAVNEMTYHKPCGTQILGGDKGFTEVMVTSAKT